MKKQLLFVAFLLVFVLNFPFSALAQEAVVEAKELSDITTAIEGAQRGDIINITLKGDIEIPSNINISKAITVNIDFNGYQLNYTGSTDGDASKAGFYLNNKNATLSLKGSNPLEDYKEYEHYADSVKPDMTGTGNLITILHGKLNIENMYLMAPASAWAINGALANDNDSEITVRNSVLRCPKDSQKSAITSYGANGYGTVEKRTLVIENSVIYGGFKGQNSFNYTVGTAFTNVKFYDFEIVNDCWYTPDGSAVSSLMMNKFDKAVTVTSCVFQNYDGTIGNVKITTYTGKQNLKLIDCTFNSITGYLGADRGGSAKVWVVTKMPSCEQSGTAIMYSSSNMNGVEETVTADIHSYDDGIIVYPNGYASAGTRQIACVKCQSTSLTNDIYAPIFVSLGYSLQENGNSISLGTKINNEALGAFLADNPHITLDYGVVVGGDGLEVSLVDGKTTARGGILASCSEKKIDMLDIKLTGLKPEQKDTEFAMEFYVSDGEGVEYIDGSLDFKSYNQIEKELDRVYSAVQDLLYSKHKLTYNEDGSFRVLIIADAHMNASGDATNVQEVKDRIKMLVDKENPNLVVFTGDNTIGSSSEEKLRVNIDALVSYIEQKQIPWCHVYGNHDHEGALSNSRQQEIFETYEYCISKTGPDISGVGNYVHGIYKRDGSLGSVIYFLDSGAYDSVNGGYDYIKADQIAWYKESSELLQEYNGGKVVHGMMAFHIPLIENNDAYNNRNNTEIVYEYAGDKNEPICASATDTALLETIFERGDIKAIVTGHDHKNDYMYNYYGVKLCSSPNISDLTYYAADLQGSRVFDLNLETITNIPTYVSYLIKRVSPEDYDLYEGNVTIENFEGEAPKTGVASLGGGTIGGTLTLEVVDGKGKDGSSAIEVKRSQTGNAELYIYLTEENYGRLGTNKYLVVWMDLTDVEFRKACTGLLTNVGNSPHMADNDDGTNPPYYYLADGATEWVTLSHGGDGCFGTGDGGGVKGKKGYFAFRVEDLLLGARGKPMSENTLVTGYYMYLDISSNSYANIPFYIDSIMLVEDYKTVK